MGLEIERKFLVIGDQWKEGATGSFLRQGYLSLHPDRVVRIRIENDQAMLNIKKNQTGLVRHEWEYPVPVEDAAFFLENMCEKSLIEKKRYRIPYAGMLWEVDEFFGENADLVVAEIELESEDQHFEKPAWAGEEVTHDLRYYNSQLIQNPYRLWKDKK